MDGHMKPDLITHKQGFLELCGTQTICHTIDRDRVRSDRFHDANDLRFCRDLCGRDHWCAGRSRRGTDNPRRTGRVSSANQFDRTGTGTRVLFHRLHVRGNHCAIGRNTGCHSHFVTHSNPGIQRRLRVKPDFLPTERPFRADNRFDDPCKCNHVGTLPGSRWLIGRLGKGTAAGSQKIGRNQRDRENSETIHSLHVSSNTQFISLYPSFS
jgi:hypothetical protein